MSKELDAALIDIINSTKEGVKSGIGFLQQQIPDVIQQLLIWKFYESIATLISLLVFFLIVVYLNYRQYKWAKSKYESQKYWDDGILVLNLFQLLLVIPIVSFYNNFYTAIQIYFAPKIFLINYVSNLVK